MKKVALFARVSTLDNQEYDRQITDLTKVILTDGYTKDQIEIFAEKVSGYKKNEDRPELSRLFNMVEKDSKSIAGIYVTEVSRLGRNPRITKDIIERFCELKIPIKISNPTLCTLNTDGSRNNFVAIMLSIAIEFSDIESKTMKTRMKSGKRQRVVDGKFSTPNNPYGYTNDNNGFVIIDEDESEIIKMIFDKYQEGIGAKVIAQTLNEMNIPTKFNKTRTNKVMKFNGEHTPTAGEDIIWSDTVIFQILKNTIYYGKRKYKTVDAVTEIVDDKKVIITPAEYDYVDTPAIISKEQFDLCTELRTTKTDRQFFGKHEYLLKNLMRCGVCGKKYMGRYIPTKDKVYICTSKLKKGQACGNSSINISLIESVIFDQISKTDALIKYLDNPNDVLIKIKEELQQLEQLLKNEKKKVSNKEKQLKNLIVAMSKSSNPNFEHFTKLDKEINISIKSINEKIRNIQKDIFSKKTTIVNYDQELATKEMFTKAKENRTELTSILKQFIDKIIINTIDRNYILVNVFIKLKGVVLKTTLKLFIYSRGVRSFGGQKEKIYKYMALTKMVNEPVYNFENKLMVECSEIFEELKSIIKYAENDKVNMYEHKIVIIPKENWIHIN
jgi:site-specific DNA recombinase